METVDSKSERTREEALVRILSFYKDMPDDVRFFLDVQGDGWSMIFRREKRVGQKPK